MDAQLHRTGWRGEDLGLPTGQGTLTALRTGGGGRWEEGGKREAGRRWKFLIKKKRKKRN